ncbi:ABC transporter family substrate-binding protein [Streptomyces sp. URMC 129]|uniref:ABC transporter family substrate-binding protein n=1 Tax=Streptomyces sp. URMC 129 TaxID=3423407 RepID=UPI003F19422F
MPARPGPVRAVRYAVTLLAGALLVPLLAGCTGQDEHDAAVAGAAQSVTTARRAQLKSGGSVTWGIDHLPTTLNAFQSGADRVTDQVVGAVLPMLFTIDGQGRPQLNTDYLRSAEITEREPRQTVVYTLHPEARWSDGEPIGAADFVAQWKALGGKDTAFRSARDAGYDRIEKVAEGPGRHQVKVTFAKPYADWKSLFTPLYPRSVTGDAEVFNEGIRDGLPAAGGPFELKEIDAEESTVTLVRNDKWWGDPALLDRLVFAAVPRDQRRAALIDGKLDVAELSPADADRVTAAGGTGDGDGDGDADGDRKGEPGRRHAGTVDALHDLAAARLADTGDEAAARERFARSFAESERARERAFATREEAARERLRGFTVHRAYDATYTHLALNGSSPALSDERVRWAIARALDREALAAEVHEPAGLPARPLGNHLRVLGQSGYRDNSDALGETGADAARAVLEEAGWRQAGAGAEPDADDGRAGEGAAAVPVRAKDGKPLELRFVLPSGAEGAPLRQVGRSITRMLAEIGVAAETTEVDPADYFTRHIAEGAFDLALFAWPATAYPATDAGPLFAKPRSVPGGETLIAQNYTRVGTDYIDQLLAQAAGELDEKEHDRLLNKADARLWAAAGSIPLFQRPHLVATPTDLAGVGAFGMQTPRYQDIGYRR